MIKRVQRPNQPDKASESVATDNISMDQEILFTLKQINDQLTMMKQQSPNGVGTGTQQQPQATVSDFVQAEELTELFSKLIESKGKQNQNQQSEQLEITSNTKKVQTAKQILAEAQYELANELEESLKKLKQVISESEKIATKMSNLLGQESQDK